MHNSEKNKNRMEKTDNGELNSWVGLGHTITRRNIL